TGADGGEGGLDVLHRVVDREQRRDVATGAGVVGVDVLVVDLRLEVQQLGADPVGDGVVDGLPQEDDVGPALAGETVRGSLAPAGLLDDVRDVVVLAPQARVHARDAVDQLVVAGGLGHSSSSVGASASASSASASAVSSLGSDSSRLARSMV